MYSSMTTICLLPGIAASLLPFPPGLPVFLCHIPAPTKTAKKAPGPVLKDPTLRDFRSSCGYLPAPRCETAKKAPGWVLKDPALRGFRRRFCTASIHRGQLSEPCKARRVCPNGCEKGVRKRQETQQVDRETPPGAEGTGGRREYRKAPGDYSVMEANSCRNAEFQ